ncbi:MAG: RNA ligase, partial [Myxococcales bacterium]|nr:RNA ligase [Myxococcales bacterium]
MDHRPFPKIPTTLQDSGGVGSTWVATEKIHGAQLVVATDGEVVRLGKRKAWLEPDDAFFGWQMLRGELERKVRRLYARLDRGGELHVYGELFGGGYPHSEVAALPGLRPVQTGIWYSPALGWAPFDALVVGEAEPVFVAHTELEGACAEVELGTPPRLGRGTRSELGRLPVRYPSRVAAALGLPALPDNVAEGYVLKPDAELPAAGRPVVKHKIPEFSDDRFDGSRPFDANAHLDVEELLRLAEAMIGPMRVASARSKVGEEREAVIEEVVLDVWIDLE